MKASQLVKPLRQLQNQSIKVALKAAFENELIELENAVTTLAVTNKTLFQQALKGLLEEEEEEEG
jgi:hypothetical protein